MQDPTNCPKCKSENIYNDGNLWNCPECSFEWSSLGADVTAATEKPSDNLIRDAFGHVLNEGDTITIIKDLKIKGATSVLKVGTKVKNIRLVIGSGDGHDISCRVEGLGLINLKSEFVKKV